VKVYLKGLSPRPRGGKKGRRHRTLTGHTAARRMNFRVYLKQLSFALAEAAASDNPRVIDLALALVEAGRDAL